MKIGVLGDLHLRSSAPLNRTDNYYTTQFEKLEQAFTHFESHCEVVIQPGDFFNNYGQDAYSLVYDIISFLKQYNIPVYAVSGQHDTKFHNIKGTDTPFKILAKSGIINLANKDGTKIGKNVHLYGTNFGEFPKLPNHKNKQVCNILCMHKMIIHGKKLFPGQSDYTQARILKRKYSYDFFVCGDNHQAFTLENHVINCGSLCRMHMDQISHTPIYGIYDTNTKELKTYEYDIAPASEVLKEIEFKKLKADEKRRKEFADSLHMNFKGETDYRKNIENILKEKKRVKRRSKEIIEEGLNGRRSGKEIPTIERSS